MSIKFKLLPLVASFVCLGTVSTYANAETPTIKIDGSSTVFPISAAVAEEFQKAKKGAVKVPVSVSGTGGGFKKFCRGEIDISDASRPISAKEMADCKAKGITYFELPVAYDALTIVVNPQNTWAKNLTIAQLKKIFEPAAQGKIKNWKDVDPSFPDQNLKLYGPGTDSGTFDYFTEAVVGKAKSSRGDYTASEDDNVLVQGVSRDKGGLAYFGYAYYQENQKKVKAVAVEGKLPSTQGIETGAYTPLSRPIFIYVNAKSMARPEIKEFVDFYMKKGPALVKAVKYVALPAKVYTMNAEHITKNKIGTVFGGKEAIGLKIDDLMKRNASF